MNYNLTIRVSAEDYESLFNLLTHPGSRPDNKSSTIEDVTERYYDQQIRITNKKARERRYMELLKKVNNIGDIIEIEKNINDIRTEIEQLEVQFNYLSERIGYSTIQLSFYELLP